MPSTDPVAARSGTLGFGSVVVVRAREVCRRIERLGGVHVHTRGSHRTYVLPYGDGRRLMTRVPVHPGDVNPGTLRQIQRDLEQVLGRGWLIR